MSQNVKRVRLRDSIAFRYLTIATLFLIVVQLLFGAYELYMASQLQEIVGEMKASQEIAEEANKAAMPNEARTRLVVDTALDAVIEMDGEGFIMTWNKQAESIFGWKKDEVIGQRLSHIVVPHELREAHEKGLTRYMRTGQKSVLGIGTMVLSKQAAELMALARQGQINKATKQVATIEQEYKRIEETWQTLQDQF